MTITSDPHEEEHKITPQFEKAAQKRESRRGFFLALPSYVYLVIFFVIPLFIVLVYSFATRNRFGGTDLSGWNLESYERIAEPIVRTILFRSLWLAFYILLKILHYPLMQVKCNVL